MSGAQMTIRLRVGDTLVTRRISLCCPFAERRSFDNRMKTHRPQQTAPVPVRRSGSIRSRTLAIGIVLTGALSSLTAAPPDSFERGRTALRQREFATAVKHFEQAVADGPDDADNHAWLGNACAWMAATVPTAEKPRWGRRALASYRRALTLDPEHVDAHFSLMNFYRHVPVLLGGGMTKAWAQAREVARRDAARGALARALLPEQEGRMVEALQVLRAEAAAHPDNFSLNFNLGRLAVGAERNLAEGESALRRCLDLEPTGSQESRAEVQALLIRLAQLRKPEPPIAAARE